MSPKCFLIIPPAMRTNLQKLLDLLIFVIYLLDFSLEFFIVADQLNINFLLIETKLHQFSRFVLIVNVTFFSMKLQ